MRSLPRLALLLALLAAPHPAGAAEEPARTSAPANVQQQKPDSVEITPKNLPSSDRYWPYNVELVETWKPSAVDAPLAAGARGVLIRIEPSGLARIDFGRHGVQEVPITVTDLVQSANRIRLGTSLKAFPNFVFAIAPRMVDPVSMKLVGPARASGIEFFIAVFADPAAEHFAELAKALPPLREPPRASTTILFPQGALTDAELGERLRSLPWKGSYVLRSLSEGYTRTLLPARAPLPFVQLLTSEGRVLFESRWDEASVPKLTAALDAAIAGSAGADAAGSARAPEPAP